jgi:hypothetical protein
LTQGTAARGWRTYPRPPRKILYATLYLACIPLFGCVYFFWLPDSFYHSTVQFEYPMMNKTAKAALDIGSH